MQESNDPVHVKDAVHDPPNEDHASHPSNEFINVLLFFIDHCRWWTLILILHNSTAEHVDADHNMEQVGPVRDNVEHVYVPMAGKNTHS